MVYLFVIIGAVNQGFFATLSYLPKSIIYVVVLPPPMQKKDLVAVKQPLEVPRKTEGVSTSDKS